MREAAFELALCAALETDDTVVSRQLGAQVHGRRIVDVVVLEPGTAFDERAAITPETIPPAAIAADVGPGTARPVVDLFDGPAARAREIADRAVAVGFFERERRNGRDHVRQTTRYPEDWYGDLVGVEIKPDLSRPGAMTTQLRTDVSLALLDRVVLATASHVTGAHRNRLPEAVGIWQFDPGSGERTVLRDPAPLVSAAPGVELIDRHPGRADVRIATAREKTRARRRLAERAYGKGWRPDAMPACAHCEVATGGLPHCSWKGRPIAPAAECGPACAGHRPADAPTVDPAAQRAARSAWIASPPGRHRRQVALDRYR